MYNNKLNKEGQDDDAEEWIKWKKSQEIEERFKIPKNLLPTDTGGEMELGKKRYTTTNTEETGNQTSENKTKDWDTDKEKETENYRTEEKNKRQRRK